MVFHIVRHGAEGVCGLAVVFGDGCDCFGGFRFFTLELALPHAANEIAEGLTPALGGQVARGIFRLSSSASGLTMISARLTGVGGFQEMPEFAIHRIPEEVVR